MNFKASDYCALQLFFKLKLQSDFLLFESLALVTLKLKLYMGKKACEAQALGVIDLDPFA